jgi:hypothetical protein
MDLHKLNNKLVSVWLEHFWCMDEPRGYTDHKTHHNLDLREAITFSLIVLFVINHRGYIQMSFCIGIPNLGVLKFPNLGLHAFWKAITSCVDL